jgi:hypothetical protein
VVIVDGTPIFNQATGGQGIDSKAPVATQLSAGLHNVTFKIQNGSGGGGFQVFYSGPDTATVGMTGGVINNLVPLPKSALYYTSGLTGNAGLLGNDFTVTGNGTWDGQGTDFNTGISGSLLLNDASVLTVNNMAPGSGSFGTGAINVMGVTTVGTTAGATVSPVSGILGLMGGITDGGRGLTKTGAGTLKIDRVYLK